MMMMMMMMSFMSCCFAGNNSDVVACVLRWLAYYVLVKLHGFVLEPTAS
jgi:hypothetical protein